jgi:sec-independent protein translocase protein TatC
MALVPFPTVTPGDDEDDDSALDASGSKMSFLEHLDELRKRLIYICWSLLAGCIVAYLFIQRIFDFIMRPMQQILPPGSYLQFTSGAEPFMLYVKIGFLAGIFIASPLIIWQVWKFIAPGLYTHEK